MIALCPECHTRYRLAREKIGPAGARIRCSKCQTIFRVQAPPPEAAAPPPPVPDPVARAVVAESDEALAKAMAEVLARWAIACDVVADGGEALLRIFRSRPDLAVLGGGLPGMRAPAMAEILRRAADTQEIPLIRVVFEGEICDDPGFDADELIELGDLPAGLGALLERIGVGSAPESSPPTRPPAPKQTVEMPRRPPVPEAAKSSPAPAKPARRRRAPLSDDPEIAAAERLARISVSDIILYNEEKFAEGVAAGDVVAALQAEIAEARQLFTRRIPEAVRQKRDFLVEELQRRAAAA